MSHGPNRQRLTEAAAAWFGRFRFDLWATFTYRRDEVSPDAAWRDFTALCRSLSRDAYRTHIRVAVGMGPQEHRFQRTPHLHALFGPVAPGEPLMDPAVVLSLWRHGLAQCDPYRPTGNAALYLASHHSVELLVSCPRGRCRQNRGCPVATVFWPTSCPGFIRRAWWWPHR